MKGKGTHTLAPVMAWQVGYRDGRKRGKLIVLARTRQRAQQIGAHALRLACSVAVDRESKRLPVIRRLVCLGRIDGCCATAEEYLGAVAAFTSAATPALVGGAALPAGEQR